MSRARLSLAEARRVALAAQGLHRPQPARPDRRHLRRAIHDCGLIQIDYVNVLVPAHYQVPLSRVGAYDRGGLDELVYGQREFMEAWAHEASIVPVSYWPLLAHRRRAHEPRPRSLAPFFEQRSDYLELALAHIADHGPSCAADLPPPAGTASRIEGAWIGTIQRAVLEFLFGVGEIAAVGRRRNYARVYDLAERVIPHRYLERQVADPEAQRQLLAIAARANGVATAADLADYFRMPMRVARPRIDELVEEGTVTPAVVGSDTRRWYLHRDARLPRQVDASALVSGFDPLVWHRPRLRRLWRFDYRIEIFIPAAERRWGYYVLPFLHRGRLVARVDLKAERTSKTLQVVAAHAEPGQDGAPHALAAELHRWAGWLGLQRVRCGRRGNLLRRLSAANRRYT